MRRTYREAFAAAFLTFGFAACIGAFAMGHADDAPGVGLIGLAIFFASAKTAFRSLREDGLE